MTRTPYFVPETTTLQEQLDAFKLKQEHFALVVDEYGALMGLVTLEDILEEIVGEIEDEYDSPVQGVRPQGDGSLNVDGDVTIRDLNRAMDWSCRTTRRSPSPGSSSMKPSAFPTWDRFSRFTASGSRSCAGGATRSPASK